LVLDHAQAFTGGAEQGEQLCWPIAKALAEPLCHLHRNTSVHSVPHLSAPMRALTGEKFQIPAPRTGNTMFKLAEGILTAAVGY
jgi:hypothetical protein